MAVLVCTVLEKQSKVLLRRLETSTTTEFGTVTRNVVRLPGDKVIFSRVDPTRPETSFVYRGRPGFKQLSAFLAEPTGMAG